MRTGATVDLKLYDGNLESDHAKLALKWLVFTNTASGYEFEDISSFYINNKDLLPKKSAIYSTIKKYISQNAIPLDKIVNFYITDDNQRIVTLLEKHGGDVAAFTKYFEENGGSQPLMKELFFDEETEADKILWDHKTSQAIAIIGKIRDEYTKDVMYSRVYLQTKNPRYLKYYKNMLSRGIKVLEQNEGLFYDFLSRLLDEEQYKDVLSIWDDVDFKLFSHYQQFSKLQIKMIRSFVGRKMMPEAYKIASKKVHGQAGNKANGYLDEFLAGFIALKYLKNYELAKTHFTHVYNSGDSNVYSSSRGAYYLARTYAKIGDTEARKYWLKIAGKNITTYYGQLALSELNGIEPVLMIGNAKYTQRRFFSALDKRADIYKQYFDSLLSEYYRADQARKDLSLQNLSKNINFQIGVIMLKIGRPDYAREFFANAIQRCEHKYDIKLIFDLLKSANVDKAMITYLSGKATDAGVVLIESHSVLDFALQQDDIARKALVHAIIKKESNFGLNALSGVGAIGLMQIMPDTGRYIARQRGFQFSMRKLKTDWKYNIVSGSFYIDMLLEKFNNSYPLALASYNGGAGNVTKWLESYGEMHDYNDIVDFVELIPFSETREYVMRVMEAEGFYSYVLNKMDYDAERQYVF